jgi:DivIVA domain-containing protein
MGSGTHLGSRYSESEQPRPVPASPGNRRTPLPHLQPDEVRQVRFTRARYRAGYDHREVDDFLDRVERQLRDREAGQLGGPLTPEDVIDQKFRATKFRSGYDQDEVDDFLDRIVTELRRQP